MMSKIEDHYFVSWGGICRYGVQISPAENNMFRLGKPERLWCE